MYKIIGTDGKQYGPISADEIRRWLTENRINAHTLAQVDSAQEWKPLISFPEFISEFKIAPPPVAPPVATSRASSKIPAGICGILLGSLGIHKFILGYTGAGLIMLLVSMLSCFILAPIMHIIGLIEGIVYLCKSDEDFARTYVDQRQEWF